MKYVCLVYPVEKDMGAITKTEADPCTAESLAYDDEARDLNEAIQVAATIPLARRGSIGVRPIRELRL
jgi:hypothetical protein